ncbi:hypothetical protein [Chitinophaga flava]|uniref:Uncharacterized protein n=1 Tax=Chitinophaga flava TaxID=2259036 RepID=A0A365XVQ8_9BACT|nr:hypothetical protein [Chitinophaga flava]RBL90452.1 hypothetical protein DF182_28750 [Chitinophaga flava]
MYPSFINFIGTEAAGGRKLKICGQDFTAYSYDWYIDDAITLASRWPSHQVTYRRILHLRTWIRENYQHGHDIPYKYLRSLQGCRCWVESVIHAEYKGADEMFQESYKEQLAGNKTIFSKSGAG